MKFAILFAVLILICLGNGQRMIQWGNPTGILLNTERIILTPIRGQSRDRTIAYNPVSFQYYNCNRIFQFLLFQILFSTL